MVIRGNEMQNSLSQICMHCEYIDFIGQKEKGTRDWKLEAGE